jgi:hypothetical protein
LFPIVEVWAELAGMSSAKFVEDCVVRIIAIFLERETVDLWNTRMDRQLETVLKAA